MRSIRQIAWHAIDVYTEYCEKGYSKEIARDKSTQEVMECYAGKLQKPAGERGVGAFPE